MPQNISPLATLFFGSQVKISVYGMILLPPPILCPETLFLLPAETGQERCILKRNGQSIIIPPMLSSLHRRLFGGAVKAFYGFLPHVVQIGCFVVNGIGVK